MTREDALKSLLEEADIIGSPVEPAPPEVLARQIFRDNLPLAAASIVHLSQFGNNERIRLQASQYVVDRVLGKSEAVAGVGEVDPWKVLIADALRLEGDDDGRINH